MMMQSSEGQRIVQCEESESTVFSKVFCQNDYLFSICLFLRMNDIIKSIPLLSIFHYKFLNNILNKKLIKILISYDFGQAMNNLCKILLNTCEKYNKKQIYLETFENEDWNIRIDNGLKMLEIVLQCVDIRQNQV